MEMIMELNTPLKNKIFAYLVPWSGTFFVDSSRKNKIIKKILNLGLTAWKNFGKIVNIKKTKAEFYEKHELHIVESKLLL